jgi:hypothetical protein
MMKISGTFLDEITCDIPSNNWGRKEWEQDFKIMQSVGIDTVILIRAGLRNMATFPSETLRKEVNILPVYEDLAQMFLELAQDCQMSFYFGTYDSNKFWHEGNSAREVEINKKLIDEIWNRYGHFKCFKGWYITNEIGRYNEDETKCLLEISRYCKKLSGLQTIISPYLHGKKLFTEQISTDQHRHDWDSILGQLEGNIDIVAFQDGHVDFHELPEYLAINSELIRKHGMEAWSNAETFDRDMPFRFPPIDWRKLRYKLEAAQHAEMTKLITFEFSHFMSPQSCWPGAQNLFNRYCEYIAK